ncbi:MAG TPA: hypothetical protein VJJ76_02450 [archaeon]|nr:hypothetical protein [archaeon]
MRTDVLTLAYIDPRNFKMLDINEKAFFVGFYGFAAGMIFTYGQHIVDYISKIR